MSIRFFHIILLIFLSLFFNGCFSEVESTPKISYDSNSNLNSDTTKSLLSNISNIPFKDWEYGKQFYVTDNKANLALYYKNDVNLLCGSSLTYIGYKEQTSIIGTTSTNIYFITEYNDTISHTINSSHAQLCARNSIDVPFLVQKSLIDDIHNQLYNKQLFILTNSWYSLDEKHFSGRKFDPISIIKVDIGNAIYPIKIIFNDKNDNSYFVYTTIGNEFQSARNFEEIFSISNPHEKYPYINNETWGYIKNGLIKSGMTQEECQLSIGLPSHVEIEETNSPNIIKKWVYNNGYILIFENSILKDFKR